MERVYKHYYYIIRGIVSILLSMVGLGIQMKWLLSSATPLNWTLPIQHHFNAAGVYHAFFFIGMFGVLGYLFTQFAMILHEKREDEPRCFNTILGSTIVFSASMFLFLLAHDNYINKGRDKVTVNVALCGLLLAIMIIFELLICSNREFRINRLAMILSGIFTAFGISSIIHEKEVSDTTCIVACVFLIAVFVMPDLNQIGRMLLFYFGILSPTILLNMAIGAQSSMFAIFSYMVLSITVPMMIARAQKREKNTRYSKLLSIATLGGVLVSLLIVSYVPLTKNGLEGNILTNIVNPLLMLYVPWYVIQSFEIVKEEEYKKDNDDVLTKTKIMMYSIYSMLIIGTAVIILRVLFSNIPFFQPIAVYRDLSIRQSLAMFVIPSLVFLCLYFLKGGKSKINLAKGCLLLAYGGLTLICISLIEAFQLPNIQWFHVFMLFPIVGLPLVLAKGYLNNMVLFAFVPEEDGFYSFFSSGNCNVCGYLYDEGMTQLLTNSGSGVGRNFKLTYELIGGKTYFLKTQLFSSNDTGTYSVSVIKAIFANEIAIDQGEQIEGYPFATVKLSATLYPLDYNMDETYTWSSSNQTVATINSEGEVSMLSPGITTVTVRSKRGLVDSCEVTVKEFPSICINETKEVNITKYGEVIYYRFVPEESGWYTFYSVSDDNTTCNLYSASGTLLKYSTIGGTGNNFRINYQMNAGETYIFKCAYDNRNKTGTYQVVLEQMKRAESISFVEGSEIKGYPNQGLHLSVEFSPYDSTNEIVHWSSSDNSVVTINGYTNGMAYAHFISSGEAIITATTEMGLTATCRVVVEDCEQIVADEHKIITMSHKDGAMYFKFIPDKEGYYVFYTEGVQDVSGIISMNLLNQYWSWERDCEKCSNGTDCYIKYYMQSGTTYYVKMYYSQYNADSSGSFILAVSEAQKPTGIKFKEEEIVSYVGMEVDLDVQILPELAVLEENFIWSSSDEAVATVNQNGTVTMISAGSAVVSVITDSGYVATCEVTVSDYPEITLDEERTVNIDIAGQEGFFKFTPEEDGYYVFTSNSRDRLDTYGYIYDESGNQLANDDDSAGNGHFRVGYYMTAGTTYILKARLFSSNSTGLFSVNVRKSKLVKSLEIISNPTKMEYVEGYFNPDYSGLKIRVTWDDDTYTDTEWGYSSDLDEGDYTISYLEHDNITTFFCGGQEVDIVFTVIGNPIESLEIVSVGCEFIENCNGLWIQNWNYETQSYEEERYYWYVEDFIHPVIKINYKDGTSVLHQTRSEGWYINGYRITLATNQKEEHWKIGGNNLLCVSLLGVTGEKTVEILESPVRDIEIISMPNTTEYMVDEDFRLDCIGLKVKINYKDGRSSDVVDMAKDYVLLNGYDVFLTRSVHSANSSFVVGANLYAVEYMGVQAEFIIKGIENNVEFIELLTAPTHKYVVNDLYYGYIDDWDGNYYYDFSNYAGLSFRVHYIDGTYTDFTSEDIYRTYWSLYINNYAFYTSYEDSSVHIGMDNTVTFHYLGHSFEYNVEVMDSPIQSIQISKNPNVTEFEQGFYPTLDGLEITVTDLEGQTEIIRMGDDGLDYIYDYWSDVYKVVTDKGTVVIATRGSGKLAVSYLGINTELTFTRPERTITDVTINKVKFDKKTVIATLTYSDGTTENVTIIITDVEDSSDDGAGYWGVAKTDKGFCWCEIYKKGSSYDIELFDTNYSFEPPSVLYGDVNGDGTVDGRDVILLRQYMANYNDDTGVSTVTIFEGADANGDGDVDGRDVILLRRYMADYNDDTGSSSVVLGPLE